MTTFLQALGYTRDEILSLFYSFDLVTAEKGKFFRVVDDKLVGLRIEKGMVPEKHEKDFVGHRLTKEKIKKLQKLGIKRLSLKRNALLSRVSAKDIIDPDTGEIMVEQGETITPALLEKLLLFKKVSIELIQSSGYVKSNTEGPVGPRIHLW